MYRSLKIPIVMLDFPFTVHLGAAVGFAESGTQIKPLEVGVKSG